MMNTLLSTALSLLCAYSQPDCDQAKRLPISFEQFAGPYIYSGPMQDGYSGATVWVGATPVKTLVDPRITAPAAVAAVLAHETTNQLRGYPRGGRECGAWEQEGIDAAHDFFAWMDKTFGPPLLPTAADIEVRWNAGIPAVPC